MKQKLNVTECKIYLINKFGFSEGSVEKQFVDLGKIKPSCGQLHCTLDRKIHFYLFI